MKFMRNLLALVLALSLLCVPVLAAEGFNAGLTVDRTETGKISVTVAESTVLAEKQPTLTIPCDYTYAKVTCPDGSIVYCTIANGGVSFTVAKGGEYVIEQIDELPEEEDLIPTPGTPAAKPEKQEQPVWENPYPDVKADDWYYEAVEYATKSGLMQGMGESGFQPKATMTRAMMWTMLARFAGETTEGGGSWYQLAQAWARAHHVSDGENPNGSITREQIVTMLWRYLGEPAAAGSFAAFRDAASVSDWAKPAMRWAIANGIIGGKGNGVLDPGGIATRSEVAQIFMNYFGK